MLLLYLPTHPCNFTYRFTIVAFFMCREIIALQGVSKHYNEGSVKRSVLAGANLLVKEGEIIVVIGRSGSGKSTLLNLICGIDMPDDGDIVFGNTVLNRLSEHERTLLRRQRIGFVFQFFNLLPTLTVEENLLLPLELNGLYSDEQRRSALALLDEVGLGHRAGTFPDRLSGGEQQRVAIVRALVHNPDVVLADEPTGNLDLETGAQALELLDRLVRRAGKTMIMATHSRDVIGLADRIITVRDGKIYEEA